MFFPYLANNLPLQILYVHLGHILNFSLDNTVDIIKLTSNMCGKANNLLHVFSTCAPVVKTSY